MVVGFRVQHLGLYWGSGFLGLLGFIGSWIWALGFRVRAAMLSASYTVVARRGLEGVEAWDARGEALRVHIVLLQSYRESYPRLPQNPVPKGPQN